MKGTRQYYNIELSQKDAEKLQQHLYNENIHFEASGCFELVHFEIELNYEKFCQLNDWLNSNIFNDVIVEQKGE